MAAAPTTRSDPLTDGRAAQAGPLRRSRLTLPPLARMGSRDATVLGSITLFLTVFGLVMVLSSSSVEQALDGASPFSAFRTQAVATVFGVALLGLASRVRPDGWRRIAPFALAATVTLQLLTVLTPLGTSVNGNRNWIVVAGTSVQPSEFVKFAMILVTATFLDRRPTPGSVTTPLGKLLVLDGIAIGSVFVGHDLGTCLIMAVILVAGLYFGGVPGRTLLGLLAIAVPVVAVAVLVGATRVARVSAWLGGCHGDTVLTTCWQVTQGQWALAAGGVFGVGLGNSVSKWAWLPEADNDFILAIIGEETGLVGLLVLLLLFVALAVAFLRLTSADTARFTRVVAGMSLAWIVGQALVNMGVVLGILPVLGLPLPFISSGGSSLVANLTAVGCVMSLANDRARSRAAAADVAVRPRRTGAARSLAHPAPPSTAPGGPAAGRGAPRPTYPYAGRR